MAQMGSRHLMNNNVAVLTIQYIDLEVVINVSTYMCTHTCAHMSMYIHTQSRQRF